MMKVNLIGDMKLTETNHTQQAPTVVDLFCGAGGLAYGLKQAGLSVKAGVDLDPSCKFALEENSGAHFECRDVKDITADEIDGWLGGASVRVLAGCAPCQPFSTYSNSRKSKDERWTLLREFQRLALAVSPEVITMENVPGLSTQDIWQEFVQSLGEGGYHVSWSVVDCTKFGIPQTRKRLVLLASKFGKIEITPPKDVELVTVRGAIGNLPKLKAGSVSPVDRLHVSAGLSAINLKRIKASKPGGTWRDWPKELRANCHIKDSGKSYPSVYGRMEWDAPSPTMTTQCYGYGNGRFGHPEQDRAISLREAAILQSFPNDYKFVPDDKVVSLDKIGTLIGNAVPPKLGEAIGNMIIDHILKLDWPAAVSKGLPQQT